MTHPDTTNSRDAERVVRECSSHLIKLAAWLLSPEPSRAIDTLENRTHIGHRQFSRAQEKMWEAFRLKAIEVRHLADSLHAAHPQQAVAAIPEGWKLVPIEPTPEIIAAAAIAVWPVASASDIALARQAAPLVLMAMEASDGVTLDMLASMLATMAPAYRAMIAAVPQSIQQDSAPDEQAAFEKWLVEECPSGDVTSVQEQWLASYDYADFLDEVAAQQSEKEKP